MNLMKTPFGHQETPDGLDVLLRNFFRAEMPNPWPTLQAPAEEPTSKAAPTWWNRSRSRMALAASVGLLLLGSWCLSSVLPDFAGPNPVAPNGSGSANLRDQREIRKNVENHAVPSKAPGENR